MALDNGLIINLFRLVVGLTYGTVKETIRHHKDKAPTQYMESLGNSTEGVVGVQNVAGMAAVVARRWEG